MNQELISADRSLVERHVILQYTVHFLESDTAAIEAAFAAMGKDPQAFAGWLLDLRQRLMAEQFRVRREMKAHGIKVTRNETGAYTAIIRGNTIQGQLPADAIQHGVQALLDEFLEPGEQDE